MAAVQKFEGNFRFSRGRKYVSVLFPRCRGDITGGSEKIYPMIRYIIFLNPVNILPETRIKALPPMYYRYMRCLW